MELGLNFEVSEKMEDTNILSWMLLGWEVTEVTYIQSEPYSEYYI